MCDKSRLLGGTTRLAIEDADGDDILEPAVALKSEWANPSFSHNPFIVRKFVPSKNSSVRKSYSHVLA